MQTNNPFELILSRLDQLQLSVDNISDKTQKDTTKPTADPNRLLDPDRTCANCTQARRNSPPYIHHRNLPATKIGKSYLIKLKDLLNWVDDFNKKDENKKDVTNTMLAIRNRYRKS